MPSVVDLDRIVFKPSVNEVLPKAVVTPPAPEPIKPPEPAPTAAAANNPDIQAFFLKFLNCEKRNVSQSLTENFENITDYQKHIDSLQKKAKDLQAAQNILNQIKIESTVERFCAAIVESGYFENPFIDSDILWFNTKTDCNCRGFNLGKFGVGIKFSSDHELVFFLSPYSDNLYYNRGHRFHPFVSLHLQLCIGTASGNIRSLFFIDPKACVGMLEQVINIKTGGDLSDGYSSDFSNYFKITEAAPLMQKINYWASHGVTPHPNFIKFVPDLELEQKEKT